jgi:hypothetical protein
MRVQNDALASSTESLEETSDLKCGLCGTENSTLLVCNYCGEFLCADHRLRDDHQCGVRRVKKAFGNKEMGRTELLRNLKRLDIERWEKEGGLNAAFDNGVSSVFGWLTQSDDPAGRVSAERIERLSQRFAALGIDGKVGIDPSSQHVDVNDFEAAKRALAEDHSKKSYIEAWRLFNRAWLAAKAKSLAEGDKLKFRILTDKARSIMAIDRIEEMEEYAVGLRSAMVDLDRMSEVMRENHTVGENTNHSMIGSP